MLGTVGACQGPGGNSRTSVASRSSTSARFVAGGDLSARDPSSPLAPSSSTSRFVRVFSPRCHLWAEAASLSGPSHATIPRPGACQRSHHGGVCRAEGSAPLVIINHLKLLRPVAANRFPFFFFFAFNWEAESRCINARFLLERTNEGITFG